MTKHFLKKLEKEIYITRRGWHYVYENGHVERCRAEYIGTAAALIPANWERVR